MSGFSGVILFYFGFGSVGWDGFVLRVNFGVFGRRESSFLGEEFFRVVVEGFVRFSVGVG